MNDIQLSDVVSIEWESDPIDVTMMSEPDPSWRFVDPAGHVHQWQERDGGPLWWKSDVPTIRFVEEMPATDEYPATGHYECVECDAEVPSPGMMSSASRRYIQGPKRYSINGEPVSTETAERIIAEMREQRKRDRGGV